MKRRLFLRRGLLLSSGLGVGVPGAWAAAGSLDDLLGLGERFLEDQLDPAVLQSLKSGDPKQIEKLLSKVTTGLKGDYVLDLAALQEASRIVLPFMDISPRLRPYASWLRARSDYFEVADQFRDARPAVTPAPGQPVAPPANPTPEQERRAWQKQVSRQNAPTGAAGWVTKLKPVFKAAGAPAELVWLGEIESSFDPLARSPAGAAGMFQLMPRTARGLGLKLEPQDERLVPEKSARASATYLRQLHRQFKDWRLALAAYNAGPGRVSDLLKSRRAASFDAVAPSLPAETQMYVPKFEAVLKRRENLALSGLKLPAAA